MSFKKLLVLLISFAFILPLTAQSTNLKIKVTVKKANIRLKPELSSPIIEKANLNQTFEVITEVNTKEGKWFMIKFKSKEGYLIYGYIHSSVVEILETKKPEKKEKSLLPTPPPKPTTPPAPALPPASKPPHSRMKRFFIRANIGYGSKSYSYKNNWEFEEYYETGKVNESYEINASHILFEGGIGFYFMKNFGVELFFNPVSGKIKGTFSASFPHPFYFNHNRIKSWVNEDLRFSAQEINLNLIYSFQFQKNISFYISAGGTYFLNVKIENLKAINWSEIAYPYNDINISPEYSEYSSNCFGLNGGAGMDFFLIENIGLNLNFRYSAGTAKIDIEGTKIKIKTGGLRASAGIKYSF